MSVQACTELAQHHLACALLVHCLLHCLTYIAAPCRLAGSSPAWAGSSLQSKPAFQLARGQSCPASGSLARQGSSGQAPASTCPLASCAAGLLAAGADQAPSIRRLSLIPAACNLGAAPVHSSTAGKPSRPLGLSPGDRTFATGPDTSSSDSDDKSVPPQGAFLLGAKLGDVYLMPRWALVAVTLLPATTACCFIRR